MSRIKQILRFYTQGQSKKKISELTSYSRAQRIELKSESVRRKWSRKEDKENDLNYYFYSSINTLLLSQKLTELRVVNLKRKFLISLYGLFSRDKKSYLNTGKPFEAFQKSLTSCQ